MFCQDVGCDTCRIILIVSAGGDRLAQLEPAHSVWSACRSGIRGAIPKARPCAGQGLLDLGDHLLRLASELTPPGRPPQGGHVSNLGQPTVIHRAHYPSTDIPPRQLRMGQFHRLSSGFPSASKLLSPSLFEQANARANSVRPGRHLRAGSDPEEGRHILFLRELGGWRPAQLQCGAGLVEVKVWLSAVRPGSGRHRPQHRPFWRATAYNMSGHVTPQQGLGRRHRCRRPYAACAGPITTGRPQRLHARLLLPSFVPAMSAFPLSMSSELQPKPPPS